MYSIKPIIDSTVKLEGPLTTMYHMRNIYEQPPNNVASSTDVSASHLQSPTSSVGHIRTTPLLPSNIISQQIANLIKVMD